MTMTVTIPTARSERACPFVGPRSFRYGEPLFGREREIPRLLDLLMAERIVMMFSPSGAGKTSLIQAGLTPALREEGFLDLPIIRVRQPDASAARPRARTRSTASSWERWNPWSPPGPRSIGPRPRAWPSSVSWRPRSGAGPRPSGRGPMAAGRTSC